MIGWGLVSASMAFVSGPASFIVTRFFLGAAEAGFFPGVVLYMTYWFPSSYRARAVGFLFAAVPCAGVIGSPISGALLSLEGVLGLHGWQLLYVIESLPAILLGIWALVWLTGRPAEAKWLKPEQREWLANRIEEEVRTARHARHMTLWQILTNPIVLTFALICAASGMPSMMMPLWQPAVFKEFGLTHFENGLVNAIPNAVAVVAMIFWGRRSDRTGERVWHNFIPLMAIVVGLLGLLVLRDLWSAVVLISIVIAGTYACKGPFWALATERLPGSVAAASIAQINGMALLGASAMSYAIGAIKDATGSSAMSFIPMVVVTSIGALAIFPLTRQKVDNTVPVTE
jgi:MFS family permease